MYRWSFAHAPWWRRDGIQTRVSRYGTFRIAPELVFGTYNFEEWGSGSNDGFHRWMEYCRDKRVVFDIGAHVGLYALPASRVLAPDGRLYAFEPGDDNRAFLERHLAMNALTNVEVIPHLVGDAERDDVLLYPHSRDGAMHSIVRRSPEHGAAIRKRQICLDTICAERGLVPEVIKIDVEGAEIGVLAGAARVLRATRPTIILSVHPRHLAALGRSTNELREQIDALGYDVHDMYGVRPTAFSLAEYLLTPKVS